MSKIDELISELCPEGVASKRLGEVCSPFSGFPFKSELFNSRGEGIPLIRIRDVNSGNSETFYDGDFQERFLVRDGDILIGMDGDFNCIEWDRGTALLNQRVSRLQDFSPSVMPRFIYFLMQIEIPKLNVGKEQSTIAHISGANIRDIRIPVPPLEVQHKIVSILDKFTQLEAELEAELEARRSQYEHTRDQLLDFSGDLSHHPLRELIAEFCPNGVGMKKLESLTKTVRAPRSIPRSQYLDSGILPVIDQSQLPIAGYVNELDVALDIGACVVFGDHTREVKFVDYPFAAGADGTVILSAAPAMLPRYLYFVMAALRITSRGYNRHWSAVKNIEVPVPPLEVQREIVSILDKLDALVNDLTFGLPAEISARRKQYEHYRNKLLAFKELETA
jgi:type I restriction enzyme S subunit